MASQRLLVLGTHNRKKCLELRGLLAPLGIELRALDDFPAALEVVEDGHTFAENAALKARQQAKHLGHWVVGEDSGLVVDALGGRPGIYSARYSGPAATDAANNAHLLGELADTPLSRRNAHYVCHATLADPQGKIRAECEDYCRGRIRPEPAGQGGFGYDPLFEVVEYHRTFGQLGDAVKSVLSHRSRALRRLVASIEELLACGAW